MSYIIHKDEKKKKIVSVVTISEPYIMKPKLKKRQGMLEIAEIKVVNEEIIKTICQTKFDRIFKRLTKISLEIIDGSGNESDGVMALNEILRTKEVILDQYRQYMSKLEIKKMLKKLTFLEEQIKNYLVNLNYQQQFLGQEQGKSR